MHSGDALVRVAELSKSAVVFVQSANMAKAKDAVRPEDFKTGSGIIVTQDGFVIINYHVISGINTAIMQRIISIFAAYHFRIHAKVYLQP